MENYEEFSRMAKLMTSIHATTKKLVRGYTEDVEMKISMSPPKKWQEDCDDLKMKFGGKEEIKYEEDGEPLQSLNNNIGF